METITLKEFEKKLRKDPVFRKAEFNLQYNSAFQTTRILFHLRVISGLTQQQLAKKANVKQSSISRAETKGCQLSFLYRIAKSTGRKLEIKVK